MADTCGRAHHRSEMSTGAGEVYLNENAVRITHDDRIRRRTTRALRCGRARISSRDGRAESAEAEAYRHKGAGEP